MPEYNPAALGRLTGARLSLIGFRNQASGFDPRRGEGARRFGGRFNPPRSFPVVYLCTTRPCVVAELTRQALRQGLEVAALLPRELWQLTADLDKVLDLTDRKTRRALGVEPAELVRDDLRITRQIGEAAHGHGYQAVKSRSVTTVDDVVAVFPTNLAGVLLRPTLLEEWRTPADFG